MKTMNTEALFLFLIILFGLAICSFLGSHCNYESMTNMNDNSDKNNKNNNNKHRDSYVHNNDDNNDNSNNDNSNNNNNNNNNKRNSYDNYNHYTGSSSSLQNGATFYGGNGGKVVVNTNSNGVQSLTVTLGSGQNPITLTSSQPQSNSKLEGYTGYNGSVTKFYGPNGVTAVITTDNGQQAIKVTTSQGTTVFTENGGAHKNNYAGNNITSSQYYGSTGTPIQPTNVYNGPSNYGSPGAGAPGVGVAPGPGVGAPGYNNNGATGVVVGYGPPPPGYNNNDYGAPGAGLTPGPGVGAPGVGALPNGIPAYQIPPGQEDLYILKSQVVPPVCPACPAVSSSCPRDEPCPACPPCARCPEPSFECKKVPNYNAMNEDYLPQPVLNDFSSFGS
jgi:hypothetical protein